MNKSLQASLLDTLFPLNCLSCEQGSSPLCQSCFEKLVPVRKPTCFFCGRLTSHFESCEGCRSRSYLTGLLSAFYYTELAKQIITQFKYHDFAALGELLAGEMLKSLLAFPELTRRFDLIAFVPLHFWRQAYRGYNQAALLARWLGHALTLSPLQGLKRVKATKSQATLSLKERRTNLQDAFLYEGSPFLRQKILLVDDVATSGETLNQVARVLRSSGAGEVWGITFAKG